MTSNAAGVTLWAVDDMVRIDPETGGAFEADSARLPGGLSGDYRAANSVWSAEAQGVRLSGGRNEVVAFQVIIEGRGEGFTVTASPLSGADGAVIAAGQVSLFREWYIHVPRQEPMKGCSTPLGAGWYAEVAIPMESKLGNGFAIPSRDFHDAAGTRFPDQKNQAIWVDVHVPADAAVGEYAGQITVANGAGESATIELRLEVLTYQIPAEMSMIAHLVNYGQTVAESKELMLAYYRQAYRHRCVINDDKAPPTTFDGQEYDWAPFDEKFAAFFDGTAFIDGPTAGVPIRHWAYPINFETIRPDKGGKHCIPDWPLPIEKSPTGFGVLMNDDYRRKLTAAMRKWEEHFIAKGWTDTVFLIYQDCVDEPGFHKSGDALQAGREQGEAITETAKVVADSGLTMFRYRFDAGGGFIDNKLDLDGDGAAAGPMDVARHFGPTCPLWYIHGLCVDIPAVRHLQEACGATVAFYNGFEPRVAPNAIHGALLGMRMWAVAAWRDGLSGWVDWQFRLENDMPRPKTPTHRQVFYETQNQLQRNLYLYRGEQIGLDGHVLASLRMKSMRRGAQDYEMLRLLTAKDGDDRRAQRIASGVCQKVFSVDVDTTDFQDDAGTADQAAHAQAGTLSGLWSNDPAAWAEFHHQLAAALSE